MGNRIAALFAAICLLDAANCVLIGHDDWWFPALIAALCAAMIRPRRKA